MEAGPSCTARLSPENATLVRRASTSPVQIKRSRSPSDTQNAAFETIASHRNSPRPRRGKSLSPSGPDSSAGQPEASTFKSDTWAAGRSYGRTSGTKSRRLSGKQKANPKGPLASSTQEIGNGLLTDMPLVKTDKQKGFDSADERTQKTARRKTQEEGDEWYARELQRASRGLRSAAGSSGMIHGDEHPMGELPCFPSVDSNSSSSAASSAAPVAESSVRRKKPDEAHLGEASELQAKGCNAPRYHAFPSCSNCVSRRSAEWCRFLNLRFFRLNKRTGKISEPFFASLTKENPALTYLSADAFDISPHEGVGLSMMSALQAKVAINLVPLIQRELLHTIASPLAMHATIFRPVETDWRRICDFCSVNIFSGAFSCTHCGHDYCFDCYALLPKASEALLKDEPDSPAISGPASLMAAELHSFSDKSLPRLTKCSLIKGNPKAYTKHSIKDFLPVSSFHEKDLKSVLLEMYQVCLARNTAPPLSGLARRLYDLELAPALQAHADSEKAKKEKLHELLAGLDKSDLLVTSSRRQVTPIDPSCVPSQGYFEVEAAKVTEEMFRAWWQRGDHVVMTGCNLAWTPQDFIRVCGDQISCVVECQRSVDDPKGIKQMSLRKFFGMFGRYETKNGAARDGVWKLRDWPTSSEFSKDLPDHFQELMNALPMPQWTRRDGINNVTAYCPKEIDPPDIGPKLYAAFMGKETAGGQGSTRIHMDMADAVNVCVHAEKMPDGRPGCAAWDIFRAEDTPKLRHYLQIKFMNTHFFQDPIHAGSFFIDSEMKAELYQKYNIAPTRIYQYAGDVVFVPAGCAHQVCNMADCIKVALDFVSPENIDRCATLSAQFQRENLQAKTVWKPDVLALQTTMWHAWMGSRSLDAERKEQGLGPASTVAGDVMAKAGKVAELCVEEWLKQA